jgi:hypothetical protein
MYNAFLKCRALVKTGVADPMYLNSNEQIPSLTSSDLATYGQFDLNDIHG